MALAEPSRYVLKGREEAHSVVVRPLQHLMLRRLGRVSVAYYVIFTDGPGASTEITTPDRKNVAICQGIKPLFVANYLREHWTILA